ncbi:MAG: hypothetical protein OXQ30_11845, partial [Boseongicola sp.]|nr:hypothetical protein [Boseongicola sp.]
CSHRRPTSFQGHYPSFGPALYWDLTAPIDDAVTRVDYDRIMKSTRVFFLTTRIFSPAGGHCSDA